MTTLDIVRLRQLKRELSNLRFSKSSYYRRAKRMKELIEEISYLDDLIKNRGKTIKKK